MPARCFPVLTPDPQAAPSPHAQAWGQADGVDFTDHVSSCGFPQLTCGPVNSYVLPDVENSRMRMLRWGSGGSPRRGSLWKATHLG